MRNRAFYLMLIGVILIVVAMSLLVDRRRGPHHEFTPRDLVPDCKRQHACDWPDTPKS